MKSISKSILIKGIKIDRTNLVNDYKKGADYNSLSKYIILHKTNQPLLPNKKYKIAFTEKSLTKASNPKIKALKNSAFNTKLNAKELFINHIKNNNGNLCAKCDVRIS